ncbi:N-6 DNA methylase [Streptomyces atratus]|uniref:class I SAM-dependent DNA methyltransferase n=1 Tax=Streptomyces atratus TaxID=1893 RepID=UPI00324605EE
MNQAARRLVDRLWNYCNVLRDDGVSSLDYLEQLSFLVFLKMADQIETENNFIDNKLKHRHVLPTTPEWKNRGWRELLLLSERPLEKAYSQLLHDLGERSASDIETTLSLIFFRARNRIENAANLRRLIVDLIDKEDWKGSSKDIKGDAYEALIARSAEDTKAGAGQYFTPRVLIESIVRCTRPTPDDTITDPACGTGGFLLAAHDYITSEYKDDLDTEGYERLRSGNIWGTELVPTTARLAAMNFLLHNIGKPDGKPLIEVKDALAKKPEKLASLVLANPPFGRKSSIVISTEDGKVGRDGMAYERKDFWETTTNKQLNFLQHIATQLTDTGRAAVILPDNALFEGGRGAEIRRELLLRYDLHTILRLPEGIFYAGDVKANVLFFQSSGPRRSDDEPPRTQQLWVYDLRSGSRFTLKRNPLKPEHLADFENLAFHPDDPDRKQREPSERFQVFDGAKLAESKDVNLDIGLMDTSAAEAAEAKSPGELVQGIAGNLHEALSEIDALAKSLGVKLPAPAARD